jgi:hypothetical protein
MYITEEEKERIYREYEKIITNKSNLFSKDWEKSGEYFCQFSVYSDKDYNTSIQNIVK